MSPRHSNAVDAAPARSRELFARERRQAPLNALEAGAKRRGPASPFSPPELKRALGAFPLLTYELSMDGGSIRLLVSSIKQRPGNIPPARLHA
jgi:hypothetical protein